AATAPKKPMSRRRCGSNIGLAMLRLPLRSVYRMLNLPPRGDQVLGAGLNRSESPARRREIEAPGDRSAAAYGPLRVGRRELRVGPGSEADRTPRQFNHCRLSQRYHGPCRRSAPAACAPDIAARSRRSVAFAQQLPEKCARQEIFRCVMLTNGALTLTGQLSTPPRVAFRSG